MRFYRIQHAGAAHYASANSDDQLDILDAAPWQSGRATGVRIALADAQLLAPVSPSKIVCVGRNYAAHAKELGNDVPSEPLLFLKPPSALLAPELAIVLPGSSERVEHEAEVGVVIGKRLKNASSVSAREAIFGITCINDVTARDLQRKDVQFTRAKSFDGFCPVGPHVESEFDLGALTVIGRVNGVVRQTAPVSQMVFPIAELVAFISQVMTLEPGDLIATGTPEGVGPLVSGDVVEIEVSGVGVLRNRVTRAA
jgi:2-keto-4-pentenoate hydratase/2-oxohepta-3-ene-1,7-dioic acid hydratase in catechol pathway